MRRSNKALIYVDSMSASSCVHTSMSGEMNGNLYVKNIFKLFYSILFTFLMINIIMLLISPLQFENIRNRLDAKDRLLPIAEELSGFLMDYVLQRGAECSTQAAPKSKGECSTKTARK